MKNLLFTKKKSMLAVNKSSMLFFLEFIESISNAINYF